MEHNSHQNKELAGFYPSVQDRQPTQILDRFELYQLIMDGTYEKATKGIHVYSGEDIKDNFSRKGSKAQYQALKVKTLPAALFAQTHRDGSGELTRILTADIDDLTEELFSFFEGCRAIPCVEAAGLSVSGIFNGSMWANFKIQLPEQYKDLPKRLKKRITKSKDWKQQLYRLYQIAIAHYIKRKYCITISSTESTRLRYLTHDPDLYVNPDAKAFSCKQLVKELKRADKAPKVEAKKGKLKIEGDTWQKACTNYAVSQGVNFEDGSYHNAFNRFAIMANLLGVDETECTNYLSNTYEKETGSNCISFPYDKYKTDFAKLNGLLGAEKIESSDLLGKSGYLSSDKLATILYELLTASQSGKHIKALLKVLTGKGKTTATVRAARKLLAENDHLNILLITPYKTTAEKHSKEFELNLFNESKAIAPLTLAVYDQVKEMSIEQLNCFDLVIVDEVDRLYTSNYRKSLAVVLHRLREKPVFALSATPGVCETFFDKVYSISSTQRNTFYPIAATDTLREAHRQAVKAVSKKQTVHIRVNSAKQGIALRDELRDIGINAKFVCSAQNKRKHERDEQTYNDLMAECLTCDVLISTSCLDVGISIQDKIDKVIIVDCYDWKAIVQVKGRSRNHEPDVIWITKELKDQGDTPPNLKGMLWHRQRTSKRYANDLNEDRKIYDSGSTHTLAHSAGQLVSFDQGEYFPNLVAITSTLEGAQEKYYRNNWTAFKDFLSDYFDIQTIEQSEQQDSPKIETVDFDDTPIRDAVQDIKQLPPQYIEHPISAEWELIKSQLKYYLLDDDLRNYKTRSEARTAILRAKNYYHLKDYENKENDSIHVEKEMQVQYKFLVLLAAYVNKDKSIPILERLESAFIHWDALRKIASKVPEMKTTDKAILKVLRTINTGGTKQKKVKGKKIRGFQFSTFRIYNYKEFKDRRTEYKAGREQYNQRKEKQDIQTAINSKLDRYKALPEKYPNRPIKLPNQLKTKQKAPSKKVPRLAFIIK